MNSNLESDLPSHVDCDSDSNLDLGPGARVNNAKFTHSVTQCNTNISHTSLIQQFTQCNPTSYIL